MLLGLTYKMKISSCIERNCRNQQRQSEIPEVSPMSPQTARARATGHTPPPLLKQTPRELDLTIPRMRNSFSDIPVKWNGNDYLLRVDDGLILADRQLQEVANLNGAKMFFFVSSLVILHEETFYTFRNAVVRYRFVLTFC
jgi:hypothetical protein